jgi:hypothetical protein
MISAPLGLPTPAGLAQLRPQHDALASIGPAAPASVQNVGARSKIAASQAAQASRLTVEVPGPTPTLYGIGAVVRLKIADLVDVLPGKWSELISPKNRSQILDPILRLLPASKRQQVIAALGKNGAAAEVERLLGGELFSAGAFAVWSGKDMHAAIASGNLKRLPSPALFLSLKAPGQYSAMMATKLWGNDTRGLQLGGGSPTTLKIPGVAQPAIVFRNIYGGLTRKTAPDADPQVKGNVLIGVMPQVPFSQQVLGLLGAGLRSAAIGVDVTGVAGAVGAAALTRGATVKTGLTGLQLLLARAASTALRAGGAVADRTTLYGGPAWSITATGPADNVSRLLHGEPWGRGDTVLRVAGKNFQPASWFDAFGKLTPFGNLQGTR